MTDKQKLEVAAAKARKELRALALDEEATAEQIAEATAKVDNLEARAAALPDDPEPNTGEGDGEGEGAGEGDEGDAEARELRKLQDRAEVSRYVGAAMEGQPVDGAEAELNAGLGMGAGAFPLRLLAPEARATTDADGQANQGTWVDRIFADSAAAFLGITMPSVGPGIAAYPVTGGGPSPAQRGRTEAADDGSLTVSVKEVKPTRNAVRAIFSIEDAARLPGIEDALRRDMRMAMTEAVDRAILMGDAGANEDGADITGLNTATGVSETTITQTNRASPNSVLAKLLALVDGKTATMLGDLRAVLSIGAYRLWAATRNDATDSTLLRFIEASGLPQVRVRDGIATGTGTGAFAAFVGRQRGIRGSGVAPVWEAARLIRDPYTKAATGEVAVTLTTLWGFALPRATNYGRVKFVA